MQWVKYALIFALFTVNKAYGWQEFHGGDQESMGFYLELDKVLTYFAEIPSLYKFQDEVQAVVNNDNIKIVLLKTEINLDGSPKAALVKKMRKGPCSNFNKCELQVDINKFKTLSGDEKRFLLLHEISHLSYPEDVQYQRSIYYMKTIQEFTRYAESLEEMEDLLFADFEKCSVNFFRKVGHLVNEKSVLSRFAKRIDERSYCPKVQALAASLRALK